MYRELMYRVAFDNRLGAESFSFNCLAARHGTVMYNGFPPSVKKESFDSSPGWFFYVLTGYIAYRDSYPYIIQNAQYMTRNPIVLG
jgi:hypothetical protein